MMIYNGSSFVEVGSGAGGGGSGGGSGEVFEIVDEKADGASGGTFTSGAWRTRDLNVVRTNEITGASLSSNQFTLPAGTYSIFALAPAFRVHHHKAKLRNITDGTDVIIGSLAFSGSTASYAQTDSIVTGSFTISATKTFELQHRGNTTASGFGFGTTGAITEVNVFSQIRIVKKATGATTTQLADADNDTEIKVENSTDEDKIRFDTAGTERMILDETGRVGIGTTSPDQKLSVNGNASKVGGGS